MCQLTVVNFGNPLYNSMALAIQMMENARLHNKDGSGIASQDRVILKSKLDASIICNFGTVVRHVQLPKDWNYPIYGHVRAASTSHKLIDDEHAHPFKSDNFVLCHNGTLEPADSKVEIPKDKIDSQFFLEKLEEDYLANSQKSFPEIINITMKKFHGKFAFIIFFIPKQELYIIRGDTADLHFAEFTINGQPGWVVNTLSNTLHEGATKIQSILSFITQKIEYTTPVKALDRETIYLVQDGVLVKVGELKETRKPYIREVVVSTPGNFTGKNGSSYSSSYYPPQPTEYQKKYPNIFLLLSALTSPRDIDKIFFFFFEKGLLYGTDDDYARFDTICERLRRRYTDSMRSNWHKILKVLTPMEAYNNGVMFPYFLTDPKILSNVAKDAQKIKDEIMRKKSEQLSKQPKKAEVIV